MVLTAEISLCSVPGTTGEQEPTRHCASKQLLLIWLQAEWVLCLSDSLLVEIYKTHQHWGWR